MTGPSDRRPHLRRWTRRATHRRSLPCCSGPTAVSDHIDAVVGLQKAARPSRQVPADNGALRPRASTPTLPTPTIARPTVWTTSQMSYEEVLDAVKALEIAHGSSTNAVRNQVLYAHEATRVAPVVSRRVVAAAVARLRRGRCRQEVDHTGQRLDIPARLPRHRGGQAAHARRDPPGLLLALHRDRQVRDLRTAPRASRSSRVRHHRGAVRRRRPHAVDRPPRCADPADPDAGPQRRHTGRHHPDRLHRGLPGAGRLRVEAPTAAGTPCCGRPRSCPPTVRRQSGPRPAAVS